MLIPAIKYRTTAAMMGVHENVWVAKYQINPTIARKGVMDKKMAFVQMIWPTWVFFDMDSSSG